MIIKGVKKFTLSNTDVPVLHLPKEVFYEKDITKLR